MAAKTQRDEKGVLVINSTRSALPLVDTTRGVQLFGGARRSTGEHTAVKQR